MLHRRSLRRADIDPLPNSPDRTDSDSDDEKKEDAPINLSALSLSAPVPPLPDLAAALPLLLWLLLMLLLLSNQSDVVAATASCRRTSDAARRTYALTLGVLQYKVRLGAFDGEQFVASLREMVHHRPVLHTRLFRIIMDNVKSHKTEAVRTVFSERTPVHVQEFLPTYNPQLNAIEECWSKVKAHVRRHEKRTRETLIESMAWLV